MLVLTHILEIRDGPKAKLVFGSNRINYMSKGKGTKAEGDTGRPDRLKVGKIRPGCQEQKTVLLDSWQGPCCGRKAAP